MKTIGIMAAVAVAVAAAGWLGLPKSERRRAASAILAATPAKPSGQVVATVNGAPILESEVKVALPDDAFDSQRQSARQARLERLIEETIRSQFLKDRHVAVSDQELERGIDEFTRWIMTPGCSCCPAGYESLNQFMRDNNFTMFDLRRYVGNEVGFALYKDRLLKEQSENPGLARTVAQHRTDVERDYLHGYAIVFDITRVPEYWKDSDGVRAKKRTLADEAWERLKKGEPFGAVARAMSEDRASASRGGDLGRIATGAMGPEAQEAWRTLAPGAFIAPVKTSVGFCLLKRETLTDDDVASLVKEQLPSYVGIQTDREYKAAREAARIQTNGEDKK